MIKSIISCIFGLSLLACHNPALALEQSEARTLLSSRLYTIGGIQAYYKKESLQIIEAQHLIDKAEYQKALELLKIIDKKRIFESVNYSLVPDIAIVAKAVGAEDDYLYYSQLSNDIVEFFISEARCVETSVGFDLVNAKSIKHLKEIENRMCSATTLDKENLGPSGFFRWKTTLFYGVKSPAKALIAVAWNCANAFPCQVGD